jgi:hypothetical protein
MGQFHTCVLIIKRGREKLECTPILSPLAYKRNEKNPFLTQGKIAITKIKTLVFHMIHNKKWHNTQVFHLFYGKVIHALATQ